jgi:hypothetical protein
VSAALWAAVISGGVAFVAILSGAFTTWRTLCYQRDAEDQRYRRDRQMRLFDSGLTAAVDFLAAADRITRARRALEHAATNARTARAQDKDVEHYRALAEEADESVSTAMAGFKP